MRRTRNSIVSQAMIGNGRNENIRLEWKNRIAFDGIRKKTGLNEAQVIKLMRKEIRTPSF